MNAQRTELLDTVSRYQIGVIAICVAINIFEAFDLFAMAYAAPVLSQAWGLEPQALGIVLSAGLPLDRAIYVTVIFNTGGAIGVFWMGLRSRARGLRPMLTGFLLSSFALMALFGFMPLNVTLLSVLAFFAGIFINGSFVALYIAAVRLYDTRSRSSGLGWGIGIGRIGAILSPAVAGLLIGLGLSRGLNFLIYATPFLVAAIAIAALKSPRLSARKGST